MDRLGKIGALLAVYVALSAGVRPLTRYSDTYAGAVKVSGARLVGFMRGASTGGFRVSDVAVDAPKNAAGTLCFTITTRDARYFGEGAFALEPPPGVQLLGLTSKLGNTLGRYQRAEVAAKAAIRANCDAGGPATYIASAFEGQSESSTYIAAVNGGQLTVDVTVLDVRGSEIIKRRSCERIVTGVRTAFDNNCRFDLNAAQRGEARAMRIGVTGLTGRRTVDTYPISLRS